MPRPKTRGPKKRADAVRELEQLLGINLEADFAVARWASLRTGAFEAKWLLDSYDLPSDERQRQLGRLHGEGKRPRGRPSEASVDMANAALLDAHPILAKHPLHFAMLEDVCVYHDFSYDAAGERFPPLADWPTQEDYESDSVKAETRRRLALAKLHDCTERSRARIRRALALLKARKRETTSGRRGPAARR
jgi:hypothetical protein